MEQRNIKDIYVRLQKDITNISKELEAQELKDGGGDHYFHMLKNLSSFKTM